MQTKYMYNCYGSLSTHKRMNIIYCKHMEGLMETFILGFSPVNVSLCSFCVVELWHWAETATGNWCPGHMEGNERTHTHTHTSADESEIKSGKHLHCFVCGCSTAPRLWKIIFVYSVLGVFTVQGQDVNDLSEVQGFCGESFGSH